jgi:hypothetical protein
MSFWRGRKLLQEYSIPSPLPPAFLPCYFFSDTLFPLSAGVKLARGRVRGSYRSAILSRVWRIRRHLVGLSRFLVPVIRHIAHRHTRAAPRPPSYNERWVWGWGIPTRNPPLPPPHLRESHYPAVSLTFNKEAWWSQQLDSADSISDFQG